MTTQSQCQRGLHFKVATDCRGTKRFMSAFEPQGSPFWESGPSASGVKALNELCTMCDSARAEESWSLQVAVEQHKATQPVTISLIENRLADEALVHGVSGHVAFHSVKMRFADTWHASTIVMAVEPA